MTFVTRAEWGARAPKSRTALRNPEGNRLHYNGPALESLVGDHARCAPAVRGIQRYHMDGRGWADCAYSDLVCPHGVIFEGRGIGQRTAAHGTTACNDRYYATMALVGGNQPVYRLLADGLAASIERLRRAGAGQHVGGHSDCKPTTCPGDAIRTWIRSGMPNDKKEDDTPPTPSPPPKHDGTYTVRPNDTLSKIGHRLDIPWREIADLNGIRSPYTIHPGDVLRLPGSAPPPPDDWRERVMSKPVLRKGARGHEVRLLQTLLVAHGNRPGRWYGDPSEGPDGVFGDGVVTVLSAWQQRTGVLHKHELGFCGPGTWGWLVGV